jgi:hypothetical protein
MAAELTPPAEIEEDETPESDRRMDQELKAIASIIRTLRDLDEPAKSRVIQYIHSRFAKEHP